MKSAQSVVARISDAADRRLAWEFFVLFSRLEYALKRSGFLKRNKPVAEVDWDRFGRNIQGVFSQVSSDSVAKAIQYYEAHPPRKQLQVNGVMQWDNPLKHRDGEGQLVYLCRAIGVVRNNLFHGGKFPQLLMSDYSRDEELLNHAKELLFSLIELHDDVRRHFFDGIDE
jgi:hypothetical protein